MTDASRVYYPLFADLHGRCCVVVGGGPIAVQKIRMLRYYGAKVTVISPEASASLRTLARRGQVQHVARRFRVTDLRGAWLVVAATDDAATNQAVFEAATHRRIFCNAVDQPARCTFIVPAIVRRQPLTIAISTGGASPAMAKHLRRRIGEQIGPEYPRMLRLLRSLRPQVKRRLPDVHARRRYFERLLHRDMFHLVQWGHATAARQRALQLLDRASMKNGR